MKELLFSKVPDIRAMFLPSLESLIIGDDKVTKIPAEVAAMTQLKTLSIPRDVTDIDPALWTLTTLEHLEVSGLMMESLPDAFCNLTRLKTLSMRGVRLTALPDAVGNLQALEELDLVFAREITTLPESFYDLKLKRLRIQYSPLAKFEDEIQRRMPNTTIYK